MKKVTSVLKDKAGKVQTISFRASGNKGGGGPEDRSPGKGGTVYLIGEKGVLVSDAHAVMIEERLGSQVSITDPTESDVVADQEAQKEAEEKASIEQGMVCTTEDGKEGTYQPDADGNLVCTVPSDDTV